MQLNLKCHFQKFGILEPQKKPSKKQKYFDLAFTTTLAFKGTKFHKLFKEMKNPEERKEIKKFFTFQAKRCKKSLTPERCQTYFDTLLSIKI